MKKLFRIKGKEAMLGGVAAGLAEYFEIDVTLVRVLLVVGIFAPVPVVLPYIILWAVMPVKPSNEIITINPVVR